MCLVPRPRLTKVDLTVRSLPSGPSFHFVEDAVRLRRSNRLAPNGGATIEGTAMNDTLSRWSPYMLSVLRIVTALLFIEHGTMKLLGFPPSEFHPELLSLF